MSAVQVHRVNAGAQGGPSRAVAKVRFSSSDRTARTFCSLLPLPARVLTTQADGDDPLRKAADWLRGRAGPEVRSSVLQDVRVDVFRSKDFLRVLPDKTSPALAPFLTGGGAASALKLGVRACLTARELVKPR